MIKRRHLVFLAAASLALVLSGCKSTPEEEEIVEEIPVVIPEPETEPEPETAPDFSEANRVLVENLQAARQTALDSNADFSLPVAFAAAEVEYNAILAASMDETADLSSTTVAEDLTYRYKAFAAYPELAAMKAEIDQNNLAGYAQSSYDEATGILEGIASVGAGLVPGKVLFEEIDAARSDYTTVLVSGYRALAKDQRELAIAAKRDADSVKAAVSRKSDYDEAVTLINKGDSNFVTGAPKVALQNYTDAKVSFATLYEEISLARAQAAAKIEAAKARVAQSEAVAEDADTASPIVGDIEGIEAEDAKLLMDDDFSDTEDAAVEIADMDEDFDEYAEPAGVTVKELTVESVAESAADAVIDEVSEILEEAVEDVAEALAEGEE